MVDVGVVIAGMIVIGAIFVVSILVTTEAWRSRTRDLERRSQEFSEMRQAHNAQLSGLLRQAYNVLSKNAEALNNLTGAIDHNSRVLEKLFDSMGGLDEEFQNYGDSGVDT